MSYIKTVVNGYILGLCECNYGEGGISKSEYDYLSEILRNRPASSDSGYVYMLNEDTVEWVKVEFPVESDIDPQPETDLTVQDTLEMLNELGVETDDK